MERRRARVHKIYPFTIRIVDRLVEESIVDGIAVKIDPDCRETGMAIVRTKGTDVFALSFFNLKHRGQSIHIAMQKRANHRRRRRSANLRYRAARFNNRKRREKWLPPCIQHRVDTIINWVERFQKISPIKEIYFERAKFDTQKMQNPEISGIEYQHGELFGYEVKEYLLEKWGHKCAYCGAKDVPLEVEHIVPKARGGSNRVSNLTISCHKCNQDKGDKPVEDFLQGKEGILEKIRKQAKAPLKDAAAMNATRSILLYELEKLGCRVYTGIGARTKFNRKLFGVPKEHCLDALCIGDNITAVFGINKPVLEINCKGRGLHQRMLPDSYGFPRAHRMKQKRVHGFATGDMVLANVIKGKKKGNYVGRIAVRQTGYFDIQTKQGKVCGISWKYCHLISRNDGYEYVYKEI